MDLRMIRSLGGRRSRTRMAVAGVAASALLVLVLRGAGLGVDASIAAYAGQEAVDVWVAPRGTESLLRATALLPGEAATVARERPEVVDARPLARSFVQVSAGGDAIPVMDLGYDAVSGLGGPPAWAEGRAPAAMDEIALDRVAAWRLGVGVGETVDVNGRTATVTGLTEGTNLLASQFAFQTAEAVGAANGAPGRGAYLLVDVAADADPAAVARDLEAALPETVAFTRAEFVENNRREAAAGFAPLFTLSFLLGLASAAQLVALIVHGLVEDHRSDLAVLLALGASLRSVIASVLVHGVTVVAGGAALGLGLAVALAAALDRLAPIVPLHLDPGDTALLLGLFVAIGAVAAAASVAPVRHVDPMEAFRS